jgi:glycosyltransferase involved in cell wall biosynthesis
MRILVVVPYGVETSGLIVFVSRLHTVFNELGTRTILAIIGSHIQASPSKDTNFAFNSDGALNSWIVQEQEVYDVLFWVGFFQDENSINSQISNSALLRESFKKRTFFLWERTGETHVIPEPQLLEMLVRSAADGIFALNNGQVTELERLSVPSNLIHLISTGVDTSEYKPITSKIEKCRIRQALGWKCESVIALSVGRFVPRKRITFLIRTWTADKSLSKKGELVIYGSGFGQPNSIEQQILDLASLDASITVIKYQRGMNRIPVYRAADFFILPGVLEGEPSVLSEAMACGLPIVASNIDGHRRLIQNSEAGVLFEPDNMLQLNAALHKMLDDQDYRRTMGKEARRVALQYRDISAIANRLLNVFEGNGQQYATE